MLPSSWCEGKTMPYAIGKLLGHFRATPNSYFGVLPQYDVKNNAYSLTNQL